MTSSPAVVSTSGRSRPAFHWFARLALAGALALWLLSLRDVNVAGMGDLGLVEVLPVTYWAAAVVLTLGFCAALLDRRTPGWLYTLYVVTLIAMLHATTPLLYEQLSNAWAWKHVSMVDVFLRLGELRVADDHGLDVYTQWPAFFAFNAIVVKATGIDSALSYAAWAPPVADALLLGPLMLLFRSFSRSRRLAWCAAWVFYTCFWVTQDYFAPQTLTFLLYVTVVALVVRRLPRRKEPGPSGGQQTQRPSPYWILLVLLVVAAIVCAHPLTPLMLICALTVLAFPRRNRRTVLPVLLGTVILTAVWNVTMARTFISTNLKEMIQDVTQPGENVSSGFLDLSDASSAQVLVAWTDRALSAGVWLLAIAAFVLRPSLRRTPLGLLAVAPLPLLALNSYSGEMLFRAYMFALPAISFAAVALAAGLRRGRRIRSMAVPVVLVVLFAGFTVSYFGKEYALYFTRSEAAASRWLFSHAPPGSVVTAVTEDFPAGYTKYDQYDRVWITMEGPEAPERFARDPAREIRKIAADTGKPVYVMLNRAQDARIHATGWLPANLRSIATELSAEPDFRLVYRNSDAAVYQFTPPRS
ncbi:glycosyltransferase [Streptomyces sp. NPDC085932]|uniref:glycosyltransferase n=1 Tax=Streptomyces sp. NPDC085932 TaxID=3365741 RepID=UPI0037D2F8A9